MYSNEVLLVCGTSSKSYLLESTQTYITNNQNGKRISFRKQLLPFLLIVCLFGLAVLNKIRELSYTVDEITYYQNLQSQNTHELVEIFKQQRNKAKLDLETKKKEIDQKNSEIEKINHDLIDKESQLSSKIKELQSTQAEVLNLQNQISKQESQLAANSSELEKLRSRPPLFTFNNESSLADIENKKNEVKNVVTNAYDVINEVYGQPYLLHSIIITFVDNFSIDGASGEINITNSSEGLVINIRLKDFDKNNFNDVGAIIHEIIHSFHGIAVFDTTVFEEGITVGATDVVMAKLIKQDKITDFKQLYLTISDSTYRSLNNTINIPSDNNNFYSSANVTKYYQMAGYAWNELYDENNNFYKEFNNAFYTLIQHGKSASNDLVKNIIKEIIPSVNGQPIDSWLAAQKAFNPS